jgi:hypothetical protein
MFITMWFRVVGGVHAFIALLLVVPVVQVVPYFRFWNIIMSLFALFGVGITCCFHNDDFEEKGKNTVPVEAGKSARPKARKKEAGAEKPQDRLLRSLYFNILLIAKQMILLALI